MPGFELERLEVNPGRGSMVSGNGELLVPGGVSVGMVGHYQHLPLVLRNGENRAEMLRSRASAVLAGSYGVLPWLEVGAILPVVLWQKGGDLGFVGLKPAASQGLGTPVLQARLGLLARRDEHPVDLALDLAAGLPVGSAEALARDAGMRFRARATVGTQLGWLHPTLDAGVLLRSRDPLATPAASDQTLEVRMGASVATVGKGLRGELALRGAFAADSRQPSVELLAGGHLPLSNELELFAWGGPGFGATPGTPIVRVLMGVSFRTEPPPRMERLPEPVPHFRLEEHQPPRQEPPRDGAMPVPTRELLPSEPLPSEPLPSARAERPAP
ncbi:OmpA domain protein [Myxococcus hansupus]|uniref:OmpA domain protein n=1 Tax=Pseudomyxococcus hansupus TaxID=1297742 RepID=A0A0H4XC27_9BACT|nr:OmpA domain protein [Myxococcus hansupus]